MVRGWSVDGPWMVLWMVWTVLWMVWSVLWVVWMVLWMVWTVLWMVWMVLWTVRGRCVDGAWMRTKKTWAVCGYYKTTP